MTLLHQHFRVYPVIAMLSRHSQKIETYSICCPPSRQGLSQLLHQHSSCAGFRLDHATNSTSMRLLDVLPSPTGPQTQDRMQRTWLQMDSSIQVCKSIHPMYMPVTASTAFNAVEAVTGIYMGCIHPIVMQTVREFSWKQSHPCNSLGLIVQTYM